VDDPAIEFAFSGNKQSRLLVTVHRCHNRSRRKLMAKVNSFGYFPRTINFRFPLPSRIFWAVSRLWGMANAAFGERKKSMTKDGRGLILSFVRDPKFPHSRLVNF
jgi:hypothetical protein